MYFFDLLPRSFATSRVATEIIQQQKLNVMECTRVIMVTSCAWDSDINKSCRLVYAFTASAIFYQFSSSKFVDFCLYHMSVFLICLCNNISRRRSRQSLYDYCPECPLLFRDICGSCFVRVCDWIYGANTAPLCERAHL